MTATLRILVDAATRTLPRKCVTSATIFAMGDGLAQHAFEGRTLREHDYRRTARMSFHGGVVFAPMMHTWFGLIGRIELPNKVLQTVARVAADQLIGGPFFPAIFYTSLTLLEGGTLDDVRRKLERAWFRTWVIGALIFTPASAVNMAVIAPQNRVLFVNGVSLSWNTYLSYTNNKHRLVSEAAAVEEHKQRRHEWP